MVKFDPNGNFLFTEEEFNTARSRDKLPLRCLACGEIFYIHKNVIQTQLKIRPHRNQFCSLTCVRKGANKCNSVEKITCNCGTCGKEIQIYPRVIAKSKSGKVFCSKSCAAVYNNEHRQKLSKEITCNCAYCGKELQRVPSKISNSGRTFCSNICEGFYYKEVKLKSLRTHSFHTRSRLEMFLEQELPKIFPDLEIRYNDREVCDGLELDIYIPSLNLAFELNGPVHFQPVFGKTTEEREERFSKIIQKDVKKQWICQEKEITLCVIDVSKYNHRSDKKNMEFLWLVEQCIKKNM